MYIVKKVRILSETATAIAEYSDYMANVWVGKGISCRAFLKSKEVLSESFKVVYKLV